MTNYAPWERPDQAPFADQGVTNEATWQGGGYHLFDIESPRLVFIKAFEESVARPSQIFLRELRAHPANVAHNNKQSTSRRYRMPKVDDSVTAWRRHGLLFACSFLFAIHAKIAVSDCELIPILEAPRKKGRDSFVDFGMSALVRWLTAMSW